MRAIYTVQTDCNLSNDERTKQRQTIVNNGMEYYARFAGKEAAEKFVDKIYKATNIKLVIDVYYPVGMKVL